ncbi:Scavenger receptor class B member 1 [Camponotus floridanus]|uniref:Scavenger receptor class B member 1 n=1 Tax=Camponotus floridanus TaxID=104421 RepID=E2AWE0_CAMFO|nr:scavenger receptor class B member 1 [Camponotus floridanus]XP_025267694.1 scavenger receptor class B member 1 [Camponotus floridanus]EFN62240.1 Scavenger receptor class B member 1 [Camponotus floridanus]
MKSMIVYQQFKKCTILFTLGIVCIFLTYVIYVVDPINILIKYNTQMTPHSFLFSIWKKPPVDIYLNVYIFNITNPVEFLSGKEKLKVQEVGPYVYQEFLENNNITFNDNGTLTYIPRRKIVYVPEMSVNNPAKDMLNVPNIPLLGVSSALHDAGFLVNYPVVQLANVMGSKPILNISVYDYLWGYEDSMVTLASEIVPNFINFKKFGLLDRMYDEGENIVTMNLRKNSDMVNEKGRYLSIDKYNGSPGLAQWGYIETEDNKTQEGNSICNTIQGATEGIIFPPRMDKRAIFRVFRKAFCRTLPIKFKKEVKQDGLSGYLYTLTDDFAEPPDRNSDNECYCRKKKTCLKKGLCNLTPCYYNIPAAVSLPHFLDADPSLLEDIEGLKPDRKKHESFAILQQAFGIPIKVHSRMQTNLIMYPTRYNSKIAVFNDIAVPIFWTDMYIPFLPTYLYILLILILQILPIAQTVLIYLLGIIGMMMIVLSLTSTLRIFNKQQQEQEQEAIRSLNNPDLKIPLCNGQYNSINILPIIKKITSKTDLFTVEAPYS